MLRRLHGSKLATASACAEEREALLHHLARVLPAADLEVEVEELVRRDLAFLQRLQAVLHADVVPGRARRAVGVDAVDVAQVVVVGPADRGDVALRLVVLLVGRLAVAAGSSPAATGRATTLTHSVEPMRVL